MLDKTALILFVEIMGLVAMPKVEVTPPSPVEIEENSRQQFTCTITVQTDWRSVNFFDSSVSRNNAVATFYNTGTNCGFFDLSDGYKVIYEISCGTTLGTFHFTIKSVTANHHNKTVECKAQYGNGGNSDIFVRNSTTITIIIPLKSINISPTTSPITIQRDAIKRFTCNANSRPLAKVIWKIQRNGQSIEDIAPHEEQVNGATVTSIFNYTGIETDDKAVLFCIGQYNGSDIESAKIRLEIIYVPNTELSIYQEPATNIVTGENVTLTCQVSGGNPLPQLAWNCSGLTRNSSAGNEASYSVMFTVNKSFNNRICTCYVSVHPIISYRPTKQQLIVVFYPPEKNPTIQSIPDSNIFAGQNITLLCTVSGGNPLATLSWNCTGTNDIIRVTDASHSITFMVNATDNNKICRCSATHLITSYQRHIDHTLVVYYAPNESLSIEKMPERDIKSGDNVTLICTVLGGNPLATLSWNCTGYKTNHTSGSKAEYRVAFIVDKLYNSRICTCSSWHPVTSYRPTLHYQLVVNFAPSTPVVTPSTEMPWFEGNSTYLVCSYEEGNPKANIQWKRGNNTEESNDDNPKLTFGQLTREDNAMQITCSVFNTYSGRLSTSIYLDIQYVPNIMVEKTSTLTNESKSISLACNASGNPPPIVKWKINRRDMNSPTAHRSILNIVNINRTDSGNYTCEANSSSAKYGNLISEKDTEVVVNYAPDITVINNGLNISEHTNLNLSCNATGKPSQFIYGWRHIFAETVVRVFNTNAHTLLLNNLSYQDTGKYECFANNGIKDRHGILNQTNSTIVDVKFKPAFVLYDNVTTGKAGTNVSVSVDVISFPDINNTVKWHNLTNNSILVNSSNFFMTLERKRVYTNIYNISVPFDKHGYTLSLHFPDFDENLEGFYNVEVSNIIGVNNKTVRVVFSDKPDPPTSFSASIISSTVVTLTWSEGFNGGNNQTFIITYWEMNSILKQSINVSERIDKKYEVEITYLIPSTSYVFQIIAKNEEGYSESANITIVVPTKDISETKSAVIGPVAGAVGAIFAAGLLVVGIILFRRKQLASGKKKTDRKNLTFASPDEDTEDGLKDNELYVSAGENFTENSAATGDVYAEIRKSTDKKAKDKYIQETVLYAEVTKNKNESRSGEVSKNEKTNRKGNHITKGKLIKENGVNDDVYENFNEQKTKDTPKNRNKDGLVYADLVFKEDGKRNFMIRGIENKTNYADIDLDLKADPLPSDESDEEKEREKNPDNSDVNWDK